MIIVELDVGSETRLINKDEEGLLIKAIKNLERLKPNGDFVEIQIGSDPSKMVKIKFNLQPEVHERLTKCLQDNTYLFAWNANEMFGINPSVACHNLTVVKKRYTLYSRGGSSHLKRLKPQTGCWRIS